MLAASVDDEQVRSLMEIPIVAIEYKESFRLSYC